VGVTVAGTLNFDNCDGLTGSGTVAGMKWCDDGGDHPLYAIVAESKVGPGRMEFKTTGAWQLTQEARVGTCAEGRFEDFLPGPRPRACRSAT